MNKKYKFTSTVLVNEGRIMDMFKKTLAIFKSGKKPKNIAKTTLSLKNLKGR